MLTDSKLFFGKKNWNNHTYCRSGWKSTWIPSHAMKQWLSNHIVVTKRYLKLFRFTSASVFNIHSFIHAHTKKASSNVDAKYIQYSHIDNIVWTMVYKWKMHEKKAHGKIPTTRKVCILLIIICCEHTDKRIKTTSNQMGGRKHQPSGGHFLCKTVYKKSSDK